MRKKFTAFLPALALASCAYSIHQVQVSDFTPFAPLEKKGNEVIEASAEQSTIFGVVSDTKYVDDAYAAFQEKCPRGHISSISSLFLTELGFFSWTNKIMLQGVCSKPLAKT
jgi:hypothetical protein